MNSSIQNNESAVHMSPPELREPFETAISVTFLVVTMVTAVIGNTAVIAVVCKQRAMRREVSNLLIINLSITDLSNTVLVMMSALVALLVDEWPFGKFWCDCTCALNYCLIIVSMLTLCCISIDRYQAVMHPLSYSMCITRRRLLCVIGYTWVQGLVFGMVPSFLNWVDFDYWEAICAIQWHLYRPSSLIYVISAFVLCFLGPGIVLIYCYTIIISEVKKQKIHLVAQRSNEKSFDKNKRRVSDRAKITWSLITVVLAYFICTTPFSVTKLVKVSATDSNIVPGPVNLVSSLLGFLASAINPLIYGIFRRDYRNAYIQLLKSMFGCTKMSQILTTSDVVSQTNGISAGNQITVCAETINSLDSHLNKLVEFSKPKVNGETKLTHIATIADQYISKDQLIENVEIHDHDNGHYHDNRHVTSSSPISCKQVHVKSVTNNGV